MFVDKLQAQIDKNELYILADLGLTMSGSLEEGRALCKIAQENGAHGVKFQCIYADELLGDKSAEYKYTTWSGQIITENMYAMFSKLDMKPESWESLKNYAEGLGLDFVCTAHTLKAFEVLEGIGTKVHKLCTWSLNHYELIGEIGKTGKSAIFDLGMVSLQELDELVQFFKDSGGKEVIPLYDFHTQDLSQMNFKALSVLKSKFRYFGYTAQDHQVPGDYLAVALGAQIIEKRLTLNKARNSNGHWKALEPSEFFSWALNMQKANKMLGSEVLVPSEQDVKDSRKYFKSAWVNRRIAAGEFINPEDLYYRRPGCGISSRMIVQSLKRMKAKVEIAPDTMIILDQVDFE